MSSQAPARAPLAALAVALALATLVFVGDLRRSAAPAAAQAVTTQTRVVFAIDNSGSMFGVGEELPSDPDQQRIEGIRHLIEVLQGFLGAAEEQRVVEVGAISFGGDEPDVLSPLVDVLDERLATRLAADRRTGTDLRAALCSAWTLATREAPPSGAGCPEPSPGFLSAAGVGAAAGGSAADARLLVVLITDGSPAPAGANLALDADPPPTACPDGYAAYDGGDGDAYLCALAATWQALRAQYPVDLAVIGLDEPGQWFPDAEAYWRRVVQCGDEGQPDCVDRVVRSLNPGELAEWILRAFPGVDLCEAIAGEAFSCDVPGGLVSVRFQIVGLPDLAASSVTSPDRVDYDSDQGPRELARRGGSTHVWRFEQPGAGLWSLTLRDAAVAAGRVDVLVDPEPATFDVVPRGWGEQGLTLNLSPHPTAAGRVARASLLTQPYRVELLRDGSITGVETVRLEHAGGDAFALVASSLARPQGDTAVHEVRLYLRTLLVGRADLTGIGAAPPDAAQSQTPTPTPTPTPAPAPTPTPTPPPSSPACGAEWEGAPGQAPRWRLTVRFDFPLPVRFRDSAIWSVNVGAEECAEMEAEADVPGCDACRASGGGVAPFKLDVPTSGLAGDTSQRRVSWYVRSTGIEDATTETVSLTDPWLLRWEPIWAPVLHLLALALLATGVSWMSVRRPREWKRGGEDRPLLYLSVPDQHHRAVPIVRLGVFVWRRTARDADRESAGSLLTLRWLVFGALVARDADENATRRARWLGTPAVDEAHRLDLRYIARRRRS